MTWSSMMIIVLGLPIAAAVLWLFIARNRANRALAERGIAGRARVTDVRDDRSDMQTIVTYAFTHNGQRVSRTGVLERHLPLPVEGTEIDIIFVPDTPAYSRLRFEEGHAA
jgi:hypothetical protein